MSNLSDAPTDTSQIDRVAFIGGGNMAQALGLGLIGEQLRAGDILVVDPNATARAPWEAAGTTATDAIDSTLADYNIWVRSEERRVGKEGRARLERENWKEK